jgi:hypothetical protein
VLSGEVRAETFTRVVQVRVAAMASDTVLFRLRWVVIPLMTAAGPGIPCVDNSTNQSRVERCLSFTLSDTQQRPENGNIVQDL